MIRTAADATGKHRLNGVRTGPVTGDPQLSADPAGARGGEARTRLRAAERAAGVACLAGSLLVVSFWSLYYGGLLDIAAEDPVVRAFEGAFPVADGAFALLLLAAALSLRRGAPAGPFLLTAAGAMSVYLGLLDATFYGVRGLNHPSTAAGSLELALNLICLGGGGYALRVAWRLWEPGREGIGRLERRAVSRGFRSRPSVPAGDVPGRTTGRGEGGGCPETGIGGSSGLSTRRSGALQQLCSR